MNQRGEDAARIEATCSELEALGFPKSCSATTQRLSEAINKGFIQNSELPAIVTEVCHEISTLYGLEESVNYGQAFTAQNFLIELSALLQELGCSNLTLTNGPVESRFDDVGTRLALLEFLLGHVKPARLVGERKLNHETEMRAKRRKTEQEALLSIMESLKMDESSIATGEKFSGQLISSTEELLMSADESFKPLFSTELSKEEYKMVDDYASKLNVEFQKRSELLLKRLDTTVESFFWSDRVRPMKGEIMKFYKPARETMLYRGDINMEDLLAARLNLLTVEKASSKKNTTGTSGEISKYTLQHHPSDRGGRTGEMPTPSTESFSYQQRSHGGNFRGGGGGRSRGGDYSHGRSKRPRNH